MQTVTETAFERLLTGPEEEREQAAEQLMAAGKAAVPGLKRMLNSEDPDVRWWALRALAGIPEKAAADALVEGLTDPDEDVRVCAILGAGERRLESAVEPLLALMAASKAYVRRHVGDALSKIGEAAVPGLIEALTDSQPGVRAQAARALVPIESQQAIPALIQALDDTEPAVEHFAWEALQRMGVGVMYYFSPDQPAGN